MAKKYKFGVNTYVKRTKPKLRRHKKRMNKAEKRNHKPSRGQGRRQCFGIFLYSFSGQISYYFQY